jgi:hypothetical protein
MSVLEDIGAFSQGFTGGVQQGMDIYQRYQTMQDEGEKRARTKRVETRVKDLMDSGGFDDQASGLDSVAGFWIDEGDIDSAVKYQQAARQIRQADVSRDVLTAFSLGQRDPVSGFEHLNKANEKAKNGITYKVTPTGTGWQLDTSVNGKVSSEIYNSKDELEHAFLQQAEPMAFADLGDFGKFQQSQADAALATAKTRGELAKAPLEQAKLAAETNKATAEAGVAGPKAQAQINANNARAGLANAQAGQVGKPTPKAISDIVNSTGFKAGDFGIDEPIPAWANNSARLQVSSSIHAANPHLTPDDAVGISDQLLQAPGLDVYPDGRVVTDQGLTINIGPTGVAQLMQAKGMADDNAPIE